MKFINYAHNDVEKFESSIKNLALKKNYQFEKRECILDKEKIISETPSKSLEREFLKIFNDRSKIYQYVLKHRKHNYLITIGEPEDKKYLGVYVSFNNKPYKQLGKMAVALPLMAVTGPFVGLVIGGTALASTTTRMLTIKGPLSKPIKEIISTVLGEPIDSENK